MRDILHTRLNAMPGVSSHLPEGTIYTFPSIMIWGSPRPSSATVCSQRSTYPWRAGPLYGPPGEGYVRICFSWPSPENE